MASKNLLLLSLFLALMAGGGGGTAADFETVRFNYRERGPSTWWFFYPEQCDERLFPNQSPINLTSHNSLLTSFNSKLQLSNVGSVVRASLFNDGAALILRPHRDQETLSVAGGPLISHKSYTLDHVIWHWGWADFGGSEHVVDGKSSPLEMQMIFRDENFDNLYEALQHKDNVVALSFSYEIADSAPDLDFVPDAFAEVEHAGGVAALELPSYRVLIGRDYDTEDYFVYQGSMTRPPCHNTVTWIVFTKRLKVTPDQLEHFRSLREVLSRKILQNSRDIQDLAGRTPLRSTR